MSRLADGQRARERRGRPLTKSEQMARVRTRHTAPELQLRREIWHMGLRFRLHAKLPGRPDLVFPTPRVAVFVDGCFWHRCPQHATNPKQNGEFWKQKLAGNVARDRRVDYELRQLGWTVIRLWEHTVEEKPNAAARIVARACRRRSVRKPTLERAHD